MSTYFTEQPSSAPAGHRGAHPASRAGPAPPDPHAGTQPRPPRCGTPAERLDDLIGP